MLRRLAAAVSLPLVPLVLNAQPSTCENSGLTTLDLTKIVTVIEVTANNDSLLLFGAGQGKRVGVKVQSRMEVDPRSQLLIQYGSAPIACSPPFSVRIRGTVLGGKSSRALEIPNYFEAGVKQAQPEPRSMVFARAQNLLRSANNDIGKRLDAAAIAVKMVAKSEDDQRRIAELSKSIVQDRATRDLLAKIVDENEVRLANMQATGAGDSLARSQASGQIKGDKEKLVSLDKKIASAEGDRAALIAASGDADKKEPFREALKQLSEPSIFRRAFSVLADDRSKSLRRELSAMRDLDPELLSAQIDLITKALSGIDSAVASNAPREVLESRYRDIEAMLATFQSSFSAIGASRPVSSLLELPDAVVPLASSAVHEGEQIRLVVEFVADDASLLASATLSLSVLRLGHLVRGVRDVAYFVTRCDNSCWSSKKSGPSTTQVATQLRQRLLEVASDRIAYENISRQVDIPSIERALPTPGVALEAMIRPRVLSESKKRINLAALIRPLGLSVGISGSLMQFGSDRVELEAPAWSALQGKDKAVTDSLFRVRQVSNVKGTLGVASALHVGLFDGAVSLAYGYNFGAKDSPRFRAIGLSFMALTDAGQKLLTRFTTADEKP